MPLIKKLLDFAENVYKTMLWNILILFNSLCIRNIFIIIIYLFFLDTSNINPIILAEG